MLSLSGEWQQGMATVFGRTGQAVDLTGTRASGGMSGSPILDTRGRVVGIISIGHHRDPIPLTNLPGWLLAELHPSPLSSASIDLLAHRRTHANDRRRDLAARLREARRAIGAWSRTSCSAKPPHGLDERFRSSVPIL